MGFRSITIALLVNLLVLGVACSPSRPARRSFAPVPVQEPPWLVLRVDAVNVEAYHPGTRMTWDGPAPAPSDGIECGLLGFAVGLINPIVGKGTHLLCQLGSRPTHQEQDPSFPDLAVLVSAGNSATYETQTARDTAYAHFGREFVVPTVVIPPEGLSVKVIDRDGETFELIGHVRLSRQQLVNAAFSNPPILALDDPSGGLRRIEIVVFPSGDGMTTAQVGMSASQGTTVVPSRAVRAGEVVEIVASGQYRVGSFYDQALDPRGYPDGGPRQFNFSTEPFHSAPHGAALAIIGGGDAQHGLLVTPCVSSVARVGGKLLVGINDHDPQNNSGQLQYFVRMRPPSPAEWFQQNTAPCRAP